MQYINRFERTKAEGSKKNIPMRKNILMLLMKLDIGGAETHVVELSKELKKRGYNIVIASNGGVYTKELEEAGIKHYDVPLQNKHPKNVIKSFKLIKKIIEDEKIDIVHSHARIPSYIVGKIHKKMNFSFVTTAHWVFSTKYGLKYITNWGEKTIAVSEDIKEYLIKNYHLKEDDITVTINGIDTEKFSPNTDGGDVKEEFGIKEDDRLIVYVSRMDADRSLAAHMLIEAIPKLDMIVDNIKVLIVGGGNDFENIKKEAERVNTELGREAVITTGARTDINRLVAPAELFVGVSRAALEAMAAGKPTIIAGNEGYIGLFDEEKSDIAYSTNFCCRGCGGTFVETLANDIGVFFGMWDEDKEKLSKFSRDFVCRRYSVKRMADDAEHVYKSVK